MSAPDRRTKLDRDHAELSIRRQCAMLGLERSGVYRNRCPINDNDLEAMWRSTRCLPRGRSSARGGLRGR